MPSRVDFRVLPVELPGSWYQTSLQLIVITQEQQATFCVLGSWL